MYMKNMARTRWCRSSPSVRWPPAWRCVMWGRAMNIPYAQVDKVAKMIPMELGITIEKALKHNPELRQAYEADEVTKNLIDMSMRLEGLPRHTSIHAAGVVIGSEPLDEFVPLSRGADNVITTQFTMTTIEELGLLKMDFLGLRTLTVIQDAVRMVEKKTGQPLDINAIDYNDAAVYEMIGQAKTEGVFQLESAGMKSFMRELNRVIWKISSPGSPCTVRDRWILSRNISREKIIKRASVTAARSWKRFWSRRTGVSSIRSRSCRSS